MSTASVSVAHVLGTLVTNISEFKDVRYDRNDDTYVLDFDGNEIRIAGLIIRRFRLHQTPVGGL